MKILIYSCKYKLICCKLQVLGNLSVNSLNVACECIYKIKVDYKKKSHK